MFKLKVVHVSPSGIEVEATPEQVALMIRNMNVSLEETYPTAKDAEHAAWDISCSWADCNPDLDLFSCDGLQFAIVEVESGKVLYF